MAQIIIYQKPCYANSRLFGHAWNAWRLDHARHRSSELRRHFDGRPDVVRAGAATTAAPGPKPKASAGCNARPCPRAGARSTSRAGRGSPADRVLDNLGQFKKPSWERACRWCRGWNVTDTKGLAEEAARGGDPRLAWYVPVVEAQDRLLAEKSSPAPDEEVRDVIRRGRPYSDTGWRAYRLKARGRRTWASIARELGLSDARKGDVALRMAKRHAQREALPWPL